MTIRNVDGEMYRALKARAARSGRGLGEEMNLALRSYLQRGAREKPRPSIFDFAAEDWGPGTERDSENVDAILYGKARR